MSSKKIIEVRNLSASFDQMQILKNISFDVNEKEITVIIGGSGSGKTTVLRHILGLYDLQEGDISIMGKKIDELEEREQKNFYLQMGVFYQNGGLLNSLTVGENVGLPLEQHTNLKTDFIRRIVEMKLNLVNLQNVHDLFPSQLSGGMLKRAALARAIVMDPPLLFCDEPGAGLDPISLAALDKLILELRDQLGISIVLITHAVSSILRIADKIIFLDQGEVIFKGRIEEAIDSDNQLIHDFFDKAQIKAGNNI